MPQSLDHWKSEDPVDPQTPQALLDAFDPIFDFLIELPQQI